jgi:hypothetical protein
MKYYKYLDEESSIENGIRYIETLDGVSIREVTTNGTDYWASNAYYPGDGVTMGEGQYDYDALALEDWAMVTPISKQEFDQTWNAHLKAREPQWNAVKQVHPVGMDVNGFIEIFYPQGVIVRLGGDALGVADYQACKASTQPQFMYSLHKVTAVVKGYDEINQWVILDSPQVHEEKVSYEFAHGNRDKDS